MAESTMKCWSYNASGLPIAVLKPGTPPMPIITSPTQILVRVHTAALNPVDVQLMGLKIWDYIPRSLGGGKPRVPGCDYSGTVAQVYSGGATHDFKVGDEVFGLCMPAGGLAEYLLVDTKSMAIVHKPSSLSFHEAAAIPLCFLTAFHSITYYGGISAVEGATKGKIAILGGSGGVGTFAIGVAKYLGLEVVTTCSEKNVQLVKDLGADIVIDYNKQSVVEELKTLAPFTLVLDCVGGYSLIPHLSTLVGTTGKYITIVGDKTNHTSMGGPFTYLFSPSQVIRALRGWLGYGPKYACVQLHHDSVGLAKSLDMISKGKVKVIIDSIHPFSEVIRAYDQQISQRSRGKILIDIIPS